MPVNVKKLNDDSGFFYPYAHAGGVVLNDGTMLEALLATLASKTYVSTAIDNALNGLEARLTAI